MKQSFKITYISNAGVILEFQDKKIMIDGLCSSKLPIYKSTPAEITGKLISNMHPFNSIDITFFTHHHTDHFDPASTAEFLKSNREAVVISTCNTIEKLSSEPYGIEGERLIKSCPELYNLENIMVKGIGIKSYSMLHEGEQYRDVQNNAYLMDVDGYKIMHVGDAKPVQDNFIKFNLVEENIDLLIVPFPYVSVIKGRQVIEKYIKPHKIIALHLPHAELDHFGWIQAAKKSYMRVEKDFVETVFFEDIGQTME